MMIWRDFSSEKSELVTRLAEGALGIREDLVGVTENTESVSFLSTTLA